MAFEEVANKEAIGRIDELADAASVGAAYVHTRARIKNRGGNPRDPSPGPWPADDQAMAGGCNAKDR